MATAEEIFAFPRLKTIDLEETTIDQLQYHLSNGTFTSRELTLSCLTRIQQTNQYLNAVTETNPDAIAIAENLDVERSHGVIHGPLHGIPILVKDNMATADKMQTTAGSLALVGSVVPRDAHVVKLLRKAGAIIIGHASMCEWASMRSTEDSIGYSARGSQVRNPYNLSMSAWGSSNGSAVAVASGLVPLAFGTETDTSIIGPAYMTGLVGIKPTVGLTSRAGVIPISENLDTVGPLARSVRDAVYGLNAIAGVDPRDPWTIKAERHLEDYTQYLTDKSALLGATFGIPMKRVWDNVDEDILPAMKAILNKITEAGATIVEVDFPCWEDRISISGWSWNHDPEEKSEGYVCSNDFYHGLKDYLSELKNTNIRSIEDVIIFNEAHAALEGANPGDHPAFPNGHDVLKDVAAIRGRRDTNYHAALSYIQRKCRAEGIDAALTYQPDPSIPAIQLNALLIADRKCAGQQLAAQAGYPIITIPVGIDSREKGGRPFGLSFQQTAWGEGKLIRAASAVEDLLGGPQMRPRPKYYEFGATNVPVIP